MPLEGDFDYLNFERENFAVIGTGGSSGITEEILQIICANTDKIPVLAFDNDEAGRKYTLDGALKLFKRKITFFVAILPDNCKDTNDYYVAGGDLNKLCEDAMPGLEYIAESLVPDEDFNMLSRGRQNTLKKNIKDFFIECRRAGSDNADIQTLCECLEKKGLPEKWLAEIKSKSEHGDTYFEITNKLQEKYNLMFNEKTGFYEYDTELEAWQQSDDTTIGSYVYNYLGSTSTSMKINSIVELMKKAVNSAVPIETFNKLSLIPLKNGTIHLNLQDLNDSLNISLNEMYIIDELIAIIELQKLKTIDIEKIKEIKRMLIENAFIIQKDTSDKYGELVVNFENIYQKLNEEKLKEIKTEEDKIYDKKYYDTLKYIYYKEIKKIIDQNYRNKIFGKIISDKEIIKRAGDILEILLKNTIKTTIGEKAGFKDNLANLKKGNIFVILIENNLKDNKEDNYLSLQEIILSFFEKSSLIYLDNVLAEKKNKYIDDGIPLDIFEECAKFLYKYNYTDKLSNEIRHIRKLFCIGYIKVYCYKFFKMINENNRKLKDQLSIENLLKNKLSEKEKKMKNIIRLYAYKTIYNQNGKELDVFLNKIKKKSYKFEQYEGFKNFFKFEEEEENINHGFQSLNNNFDEFFNKVEKYKKNGFDQKINKSEIIEEDKKDFMDNFINSSTILILSKLKQKEYELTDEFENYYKNICQPIFEEEQKLSIIKSPVIICPTCKEISKIKINSYKITLYECKNRHIMDNIKFNEYEKTQEIDISKIMCDACKSMSKSDAYQNKFYRCLICKVNLCPLCKANHDKGHKIINYDLKDYICDKHVSNFISYCKSCKENICIQCQEDHNGISLSILSP